MTPFLFLAFCHQSQVDASFRRPPLINRVGFIRATASRITCDEGMKSVFNLCHKSGAEGWTLRSGYARLGKYDTPSITSILVLSSTLITTFPYVRLMVGGGCFGYPTYPRNQHDHACQLGPPAILSQVVGLDTKNRVK